MKCVFNPFTGSLDYINTSSTGGVAHDGTLTGTGTQQDPLSVLSTGISISIGDPVIGGNPNDVLFINTSGNLGQDDNFQYIQSAGQFSVGYNGFARPTAVGNFRNAIPVVIQSAVFQGGTLDDLTSGGTFSGAYGGDFYLITIDSTGTIDTFMWSKNFYVLGTFIPIDGTAQVLDNGVTVTFANLTGHVISDEWNIQTTAQNILDAISTGGNGMFEVQDNGTFYIGDINGVNSGIAISANSSIQTFDILSEMANMGAPGTQSSVFNIDVLGGTTSWGDITGRRSISYNVNAQLGTPAFTVNNTRFELYTNNGTSTIAQADMGLGEGNCFSITSGFLGNVINDIDGTAWQPGSMITLLIFGTVGTPITVKNNFGAYSFPYAPIYLASNTDLVATTPKMILLQFSFGAWYEITPTSGNGGGGTPGGSTGQLQWNNAGAFDGIAGSKTDSTGYLLLAPTNSTNPAFQVSLPNYTGLISPTEYPSIVFKIGVNKTWIGGITIPLQREILIQAPTYLATVATTLSESGTFVITGAPIAGTNMTLTNTWALWVQSGNVHIGDQLGGTTLMGESSHGLEIAYSDNTTSGVNVFNQNISNGINAYVGYNLFNDSANNVITEHYAGMFLTSSLYTDTTFGTAFAEANQLSIYNTDGSTTIGSIGSLTYSYVNIVVGSSGTANEIARFTPTVLSMTSRRFEMSEGVNISSANNLTLGIGGNTFIITGTTQINDILTTQWQNGSVIYLIFAGALTVLHNNGGGSPGAGTSTIYLAGSANLTTANNTVLQLLLTKDTGSGATNIWREVSRTTA